MSIEVYTVRKRLSNLSDVWGCRIGFVSCVRYRMTRMCQHLATAETVESRAMCGVSDTGVVLYKLFFLNGCDIHIKL